MKIIFIVDSMNSGGTERVVSILANYFSTHLGFETYILMTSVKQSYSFYKLDERVKLIAALGGTPSKQKKRFFKRVALLRSIILSIKPDVAVAMLPHVIAYSYLALKGTGIPLIVSERNNPYSHPLLFKITNRYIFKKANFCVFQTEGAASFYKISKNKQAIIFNPISIDLTKKYNYRKINRFVATGRLVKQKNYYFMIDCFKQFLTKHPEFRLNIYGDGPLRKKIQNYIEKNNLSKNVFLVGRDLNWLDKEAETSCYLMTSLFEGMPNALIESLSVGMPSVAVDCPPGGPREVMAFFGHGRLCSFNKNEFIKNMEISVNDARIINYNAIAKLSPNVICNNWNKVINKVLEK